MIEIVDANGDFETIRDLAYAVWPGTYGHILSKDQLDFMLSSFYSAETLAKTVDNGHQYVLVVEDGKPLGFMGYEHHYKGNPVTRLHKIYVLPETQGKGIGKMLIDKAEALARENESRALSLNVNRYNNALGFYQKIGFEIVGEEDIDIGHGYLMEDYKMEKKLRQL